MQRSEKVINDLIGWVNVYPFSTRTDLSEYFSTEGFLKETQHLSKNGIVDKNEIIISVPGYGCEDLSVEVIDKRVYVKSTDGIHKYEFQLHNNVNIESVEATCSKGILVIKTPSFPIASKKIEVK